MHGILQARILEWVAMPSSRGSSLRRGDRTRVSCIGRRVLYHWVTKEASMAHDRLNYNYLCIWFSTPLPYPTFWSLHEHTPHCIAWHSTYRYSLSACFLFVCFCFLIFIFTLFYFTILYWFCHTLTWIHHGCTYTLSACWMNAYAQSLLRPCKLWGFLRHPSKT